LKKRVTRKKILKKATKKQTKTKPPKNTNIELIVIDSDDSVDICNGGDSTGGGVIFVPAKKTINQHKYPITRNLKANHYVYVIHTKDTYKSPVFYVGYTINPENRIQQHNRKKSGGALFTGMYSGWKYFCVISKFTDKRTALQCEWRLKRTAYIKVSSKIKNPTCRLLQRVLSINTHMKRESFTKASVLISTLELHIEWSILKCYNFALKLDWPDNITMSYAGNIRK
jgi:predicted GIY-YIG superfamily endonuclease